MSKSKYFVDKKLKILVEEFVESSGDKPVLLEDVVDYLFGLKEYQRKNRHSLKLSVMKAIQQIKAYNKWQEEQLEVEKSEEETTVQLMEDKDYNLFNNSLQTSYKENNLENSIINGIVVEETEKKKKISDIRKKKRKLKENRSTKNEDTKKNSQTSEQFNSNMSILPSEIPNFGFESLAGIENILEEVKKIVEWPMLFPRIYNELGAKPSNGILLHGPPGCGKSLLANAIVGELGKRIKELVYFKVSGPELISGMSGESEANIRSLFNAAKSSEPCLIFIDEIDAICPKRENAGKEMERRIVATLLTSFDDISEHKGIPKRIMFIGATNRIDSLDSSLRRTGRFDREISLSVPDEKSRARILQVQSKNLKLAGNFDFTLIARKTPGFVGSDLSSLANEAASVAIERILRSIPMEDMLIDKEIESSEHNGNSSIQNSLLSEEQLKNLYITMEDFQIAIKKVQPSAKREGFATIPNVSWDDVGALHDIRKELANYVIHPIKHPERFLQLGLDAPAGILLFGPPGCGKTLLAKAIANDCGASFISVKGPELLNKYVGESEKAVRKVFERAKHSSPCIIFFDELDALCPRRDDDGNSATKRVVNQLLTELDGVEERKGIFVIGATNRPGKFLFFFSDS